MLFLTAVSALFKLDPPDERRNTSLRTWMSQKRRNRLHRAVVHPAYPDERLLLNFVPRYEILSLSRP
jgi:hypothetical protein